MSLKDISEKLGRLARSLKASDLLEKAGDQIIDTRLDLDRAGKDYQKAQQRLEDEYSQSVEKIEKEYGMKSGRLSWEVGSKINKALSAIGISGVSTNIQMPRLDGSGQMKGKAVRVTIWVPKDEYEDLQQEIYDALSDAVDFSFRGFEDVQPKGSHMSLVYWHHLDLD